MISYSLSSVKGFLILSEVRRLLIEEKDDEGLLYINRKRHSNIIIEARCNLIKGKSDCLSFDAFLICLCFFI